MCVQGTDMRVWCLSRQDGHLQRSALHYASEKGLAGTVAKLLSVGADAALTDQARACAYVKT